MKLMIVRHAEPDYSIDSLTEEGWKEAEALSEMLKELNPKKVYVSPLGRAKDTALTTIKKTNWEYTVYDWLKEFPVKIDKPNRDNGCGWDWLPTDIYDESRIIAFDPDKWSNFEEYANSDMQKEYDYVTSSFDKVLEENGYKRNGKLYDVTRANDDIIIIFCHFGLECVLISHLLNISPVALWQGTVAAPSSVSILNTEERIEGVAVFRLACFGDTSHLYKAGIKPSFAARFCEMYSNKNERH